MNIIQIIPGSGGSFYCGNCLRDSKFYDTIRKKNHSIIKIPMYLPLFADEHDLKDIPVFYGAISIYLKQNSSLFRKAPAWVDKLLNSKVMLKLAAGMSGSTNAEGLEDMTISMLLGEKGQQKEELEKLITWISEHCKPDIIHLSNALLLGLASEIKSKLNVKVVCSLQDEDVWVDPMSPNYREKVWKLMSERSADVDRFVAVSNYYAGVSVDRMSLGKDKISTIHLGVDPDDYRFINSSEKKRAIGYISRMSHENGLDILVDAFILLKQKEEYNDVVLNITGGYTGADKKFISSVKRKIVKSGLSHQVNFFEDFEEKGRTEFLEITGILSVPVRNGEAFGIYLTEAMAAGIPIVQPNLGAFPEIVAISKGGIIYNENTPEHLAIALAKLLDDKNLLSDLSLNARKSIENEFNINNLANDMISIYEEVISVNPK